MFTQTHMVRGTETTIHFPERAEDLTGFEDFIRRNSGGRVIGLDTETTGLEIWSKGYACRLVQFGDANEAWVLQAEMFRPMITATLARQDLRFVAHNAPFDLLVLDRLGFADLDDLGPRVYDTYILAHLIDPRDKASGGTGLGLKALSAVYVDQDAPDTAAGLYAVFHKDYKATKVTGWALIDINHPLYVLYAGLDVIYVSRLLVELSHTIRGLEMGDLAHFEHRVQLVTTRQQKRGLRIDVDYTHRLIDGLDEEAAKFRHVAASFGVENINSTRQVTEGLLGMGEVWTAKTDSGAPAVGKEVLAPMADIDVRSWERLGNRTPNPLADAVIRAKRAGKWKESYGQAFLNLRDEDDRIHPFIKALAARTARMSVSTPPLQQLPSSDWTIRRAIVADPGNLIIAADYKSMELRVLAALANVTEMKSAIREGRDLHDFTAALLYGDDFTKQNRKLAKGVGLGKVFGGGATGLAKQIGAPLEQVTYAVKRYDEVYPEVNAYSKALQRKARYGAQEVVTPIGRHIPLDRDRAYACVNYCVQSTARDLIAKALLRIEEAGLGQHVLLPVHDELVCQAPEADAVEVIREISGLMESTFMGVEIEAEIEDIGRGLGVYGPTWGHGYGAPDDV